MDQARTCPADENLYGHVMVALFKLAQLVATDLALFSGAVRRWSIFLSYVEYFTPGRPMSMATKYGLLTVMLAINGNLMMQDFEMYEGWKHGLVSARDDPSVVHTLVPYVSIYAGENLITAIQDQKQFELFKQLVPKLTASFEAAWLLYYFSYYATFAAAASTELWLAKRGNTVKYIAGINEKTSQARFDDADTKTKAFWDELQTKYEFITSSDRDTCGPARLTSALTAETQQSCIKSAKEKFFQTFQKIAAPHVSEQQMERITEDAFKNIYAECGPTQSSVACAENYDASKRAHYAILVAIACSCIIAVCAYARKKPDPGEAERQDRLRRAEETNQLVAGKKEEHARALQEAEAEARLVQQGESGADDADSDDDSTGSVDLT